MVGVGDQRSDRELIAAINRGDAGSAAAFESLYYRYRDWAASLALRFTGDREAALDVLQGAFLYLLGKFPPRSPPLELTCQVKTFLYPVVRHLAIDHRRQAGRLTLDDDRLADAPARDRAPADAGRADLAAALAGLPPGQREVVLLRFVDDLSLQEIAQAMGLPLGTVKSRLHHALAALREDPRARDFLTE